MYPEVTLAQARELTLEDRALLKVGQDPVTERKATKARAVEGAAPTTRLPCLGALSKSDRPDIIQLSAARK